jgi:hypothetical protein
MDSIAVARAIGLIEPVLSQSNAHGSREVDNRSDTA